MAATDHPLKQLVSMFPRDFAVWLLGVTIHDIHPTHVELPAEVIAADLVFLVTLAERRTIVLHIEFQGRRSHEPMEWRMLGYMTRLAHTYHLEVWSVVIYVGRGAGAEDTGRYQLNGPDSMPALMWHYRVVRLWQMDAEELLALEHPALLALIGQTRIVTPATILPDVVTRIQQLPDAALRRRALAAFVALLPDEEMVAMVERLIDHEDLLLDTPFLRRLREEARAEGQAQGLEEGMLVARRRSILDVLVARFDPPASVYRQLEQHLETIIEESRLADLLTMAIRAHNIAAFQAALEQAHSSMTPT